MNKPVAEVFANRDEPASLLSVSYDDVDDSSPSEADSSESHVQKSATSRLRPDAPNTRHDTTSDKLSLQDRLLTKLLSQVIPADEYEQPEPEKVGHKDVSRPAFSLPVMSSNFRRFNARIGIVFVFQIKVARLLSWRKTSHTLSLLAVYTFVCLDPYLLVALPLAVALLFIMVPAFISRHPPPPQPVTASSLAISAHDPHSAYSYSGPPLAPARTIKPASESSKDFFRNMRDLQNSMADFSNVHDALVNTVAPATNFSNEVLSSTIFLLLTVLTTLLFISAHLIPFRFIFLLGGNALIISGHPQVQTWLIKQQKRSEKKARQRQEQQKQRSGNESQSLAFDVAGIPVTLPDNATTREIRANMSLLSQITLSTTPETREVEIFELQYRPLLPAYTSHQAAAANPEIYEWQPHLFTASPYDPLSPARISGDRPKGTRFFEDVQPPPGWAWSNKKWELDLEAGEWVGERLIVGVEYDVLHRGLSDDLDEADGEDAVDGDRDVVTDPRTDDPRSFESRRKRKQSINFDFGGWVWDLPPLPGTSHDRDEEVWLAYGDYDIPSSSREGDKKGKKDKKGDSGKDGKGKKGHKKNGSSGAVGKDWEESVRYGNEGRTGEWRRRRWVRLVRRKTVDGR